MQLRISANRRITADGVPGQIKFDHYYPLADADGHRFIVRPLGNTGVLIEIKCGKRTVQRDTVKYLSVMTGRRENGEPSTGPYVIDLHPQTRIFPIAKLIDDLLAAGVQSWQITPMEGDYLSDTVAAWSHPQMISDVPVRFEELPAHGDLADAMRFEVTFASWAILFNGNKVSHVYLWTHADEAKVLEALECIRTGKVIAPAVR